MTSKASIIDFVGVGATAATFSLLAPVLVDAFLGPGAVTSSSIIVTEIYLFPPLIAVLSAAVASLALQETKTYAARGVYYVSYHLTHSNFLFSSSFSNY